MAIALFIVAFVAYCTIADFTWDRPSRCEIHGMAMTAKFVELRHGMKRAAIDRARRKLFPNADEAYHTGYCIHGPERYGRRFVCAGCTAARSEWLKTNEVAKGQGLLVD